MGRFHCQSILLNVVILTGAISPIRVVVFSVIFWLHIADVVYWSLQPKGLKSISARGEETDGITDLPKWTEGDYEAVNSRLAPGGGEKMVEEALKILNDIKSNK